MPLGWGRAIGSYIGSHLGSLGRPPGTQKAIVYICNNEHGIASSTQLQAYGSDDRKSVYTSADPNVDRRQQYSSENHHDTEDDKRNYDTTNISDGVVIDNYARTLQIGALLAVCYNLFSAHLRVKCLQSQKAILNGNTNRHQLLVAERRHTPALQYSNKHVYNGKKIIGHIV